MKKVFSCLLFITVTCSFSNILLSQTAPDSLKNRPISPRSAMIRSAIIPGWGQWSNGKKLKSVLVVSIESYLLYNFVDSWQKYDDVTDEATKEYYRNERSKYGWWFFLSRLLSLMDAYVDAFLKDFNSNMDINATAYHRGISISLKF